MFSSQQNWSSRSFRSRFKGSYRLQGKIQKYWWDKLQFKIGILKNHEFNEQFIFWLKPSITQILANDNEKQLVRLLGSLRVTSGQLRGLYSNFSEPMYKINRNEVLDFKIFKKTSFQGNQTSPEVKSCDKCSKNAKFWIWKGS